MAERRYSIVFWSAIVVAVGATYGVYRVLETTRASGRIATQPVVVALQDLPEGQSIDRAAVGTSEWPLPTIPAGAFSSPDSVLGRVTRVAVFKGEPLVPGRLAPAGTGPGLEVKITPGKRAMAIKINDVAGISGLIQPNSRVDVLVTLREGQGNAAKDVAKLFMENMRVLSVGTEVQRGSDGKPINATTATLEVTPEEAEQLAVAANQGKLQLVLRGYGDPDSVITAGATSADVLAQLRAASIVAQPVALVDPPRRPAHRAAPKPPPPPPPPVVIVRPPPRPDSARVQVYRGSKVTIEKFQKDSQHEAESDTTRTSP